MFIKLEKMGRKIIIVGFSGFIKFRLNYIYFASSISF